ncbi:MAG: AAA family ATPase, partial [Myxococcota bacterium]
MLPELSDLEVIYDAGRTTVYRGAKDEAGAPIVLKALRQAFPSQASLAELRHEHRILERLAAASTPGVVRSHGLHDTGGNLILATSDIGARSLRMALADGTWDRSRALDVAIALAGALAGVHDAGVIHKDVNPGNVLWNPETGDVLLVDFGISVRADRDQASAEVLAGTLAYLSPEQTGRMNRFVDWRSDLYSLGATLYELFTGAPPFPGRSPLETVHAHIAVRPTPPEELTPSVPPLLGAVITKLLQKNAEDRYQSAFGLQADLERIREALQAGLAPDFPLGERDVVPRFQVADRLYGREDETAWLLAQFERAAAGETVLTFVGGYSGVGKTALVREIQRPIVERRGAFLAGKFDQFHRGLPYASLTQAFDRFLVQLLAREEDERSAWKERILGATGAQTGLLKELLPHLEALVGPQPVVPELSEADAEHRFDVVLGRFVGAIATADHPLALFLDDLQWADLPSLRVLERLATDAEARHLLVVGAYRDNEVGAAHPLTALRARLDEGPRPPGHLALRPLALPAVEQLVAGAHRVPVAAVKELSALAFEKTSGNPFFLNQFLANLHAKGHVRFDREAGRWAFELGAIRAADYTSNVVEFMAGKVAELEEATLEVLQTGAVIGNTFDTALLGEVIAREPAALSAPLDEAAAAGLVFLERGDVLRVRFVHDRVQQAAYERMDDARRAEVHLALGEHLAERVGAAGEGTEATELLFDAVTHLAAAGALPAETRAALGPLALRAARLARASSAYGPARAFADVVLGAAPPAELALAAHQERLQSAFLTGDYPAMETSIDAVLASGASALEKVAALEVRGQAYHAKNDLLRAIEVNLEGLRLLGVELPAQPPKPAVIGELLKTKLALRRHLKARKPAALTELPTTRDPRIQAATRLLMNLVGAAYYASPNLIPLLAFNTVRLSLQHGVCDASANGLAVYGLVLCTLGDIEGGYAFGQVAESVARRFPGERHSARAIHMYNTHIRFWVEDWRTCAGSLEESGEAAYAGGDFEFAAFSTFMRAALLIARGDNLEELVPTLARAADALREMQQETSGYTLGMVSQVALTLLGGAEGDPVDLVGEAYDARVAVPAHHAAKDDTNLFCLQVQRTKLAIYLGRPDAALEAAEAAAPLEEAAASTYFITELVFYEAMARALLARPGRRDRKLAKLAKRLEKMAKLNPTMAGPMHAMVSAERDRLAGHRGEALLGYEAAARQASRQGLPQLEGLALERAGRLSLLEGNQRSAETQLRGARFAYERWGASVVVARLQDAHPFLTPTRGASDGSTTISSVDPTRADEGLDLEAAMQASRALSSQIALDALIDDILRIVLQAAGAERGVLLLAEGDALVPKATLGGGESYGEGLARLVRTTGEAIVLDDAAEHPDFASDPHVAATRPLSLLVAPLAHAGRLRGVVYLENNLTRGAFTADRLQLLQLLGAQAAVSLENAQLVDDLEAKVRERTAQLELRNEFIRKTFGRYVSDDIVSTLLDAPAGTELGGERRTVTVMLADLRGFSTAVRSLPPERVLAVINNFLEVQTEVVMRYGGTIDEV